MKLHLSRRRALLFIALCVPVLVSSCVVSRILIWRNNQAVLAFWQEHTQGNVHPRSGPVDPGLRPFQGRAYIPRAGGWVTLFGYEDAEGNEVIPPQFSWADDGFVDGVAAVRVGNLNGYINSDGTWLLPPSFYGTYRFADGMGRVRDFDSLEWTVDGYVNRAGEVVVPPMYHSATDFVNGLALVAREAPISRRISNVVAPYGGLGWRRDFRYKIINKAGKRVR